MSYFQVFFQSLLEQLYDKIHIGGRNLSEGIAEAMDFSAKWSLSLFGRSIPLTDAAIGLCLATLMSLILCLILRRGLRISAVSKKQAALESVWQALISLGKSFGLSEAQAEELCPLILSFGSLIIFSNMLALIKMRPASANPAFPFTLAILALILVVVMGIHFVGLSGFCRSLIHPSKAMLPFSILDYVIRPISLAMRLFGNIFGSFILIEFLGLVFPLLFPTVFGLWFDVADGILQGLIFSLLTLNYIGEIVEKNHQVLEARAELQKQREKQLTDQKGCEIKAMKT